MYLAPWLGVPANFPLRNLRGATVPSEVPGVNRLSDPFREGAFTQAPTKPLPWLDFPAPSAAPSSADFRAISRNVNQQLEQPVRRVVGQERCLEEPPALLAELPAHQRIPQQGDDGTCERTRVGRG